MYSSYHVTLLHLTAVPLCDINGAAVIFHKAVVNFFSSYCHHPFASSSAGNAVHYDYTVVRLKMLNSRYSFFFGID